MNKIDGTTIVSIGGNGFKCKNRLKRKEIG